MVIALLTAAGHGSRMGQDIPKQFLHIDDKPVIIYTMERFQNSPLVDSIIVVTLPNWIDFIWSYAHQFNITKLKWVVAGGDSGQESIKNGLSALNESCSKEDIVIVHDGNRPLVDNDIISNSLAVYEHHGSAVAVIPCTEAVFRSVAGEESLSSIPRDELYRTQTPHTYTLGKLLWAHEQAEEKNITNTAATCMLMNLLGEKVYFSKGKDRNIKLTTKDDIELFKSYLKIDKDEWLK